MTPLELFHEIVATYDRHGWKLQRILLRPVTRASLQEQSHEFPKEVTLLDADFDALWFARSSHAGREAWELRLFAPQPYALFAAFAADEDEAQREEARQEMQAQMRDYALK